MKRCRENAPEHENLTDKQLKQQILEVDKNRAKYYQFITGKKWGDRRNYDLCINTSRLSIKHIAELISAMIKK